MLKSKFEGKTRIFRKAFENGNIGYSTSISKKDAEGNWQNAFINVQFKKDVELEDKTDIEVVNGWLTFYISKDKRPVYQIFINEFNKAEKENEFVNDYVDDGGDLPF